MEGLAAKAGLHKQSVFNNERDRPVSRYAGERIAQAFEEEGVTFETRADGRLAVVFETLGRES